MSRTERRALILLLSLALVGHAVRWLLLRPDEPPGQVTLLAALPPRSPAAHRDSVAALSRPLAPGERIDADRASALELARLPRVGPGLARRIVAHRDAHGPFGGLERLDQVPGIGPALLAALQPHVTFSLAGQAVGRASRKTPQSRALGAVLRAPRPGGAPPAG